MYTYTYVISILPRSILLHLLSSINFSKKALLFYPSWPGAWSHSLGGGSDVMWWEGRSKGDCNGRKRDGDETAFGFVQTSEALTGQPFAILSLSVVASLV
jgi:hypothetical protein